MITVGNPLIELLTGTAILMGAAAVVGAILKLVGVWPRE